MAISLPKLRENETAVTRASAALAARSAVIVLSREPSSTKMISCEAAKRSSTGVSRASRPGMFSASLKTGTITEISTRVLSPAEVMSIALMRRLLLASPRWRCVHLGMRQAYGKPDPPGAGWQGFRRRP